MKQRCITLQEAINKFPNHYSKLVLHEIPDYFKELNFVDKLKYLTYNNVEYLLSVKNNNLFFGLKKTTINRAGKNIYCTNDWEESIVICNGKIKIKNCSIDTVRCFLSIINIDFFKDWNNSELRYICKPYMISAILRKKVYNLETYYRQVLIMSFKLPKFNWRLFRQFCNLNNNVSLLDLIYFTKDVTKSVNALINNQDNIQKLLLLIDLLKCAIKLDEKVDFTWSDKRLSLEHQRQNNILSLKAIDDKLQNPIFNLNVNTGTIKLLNTERDVFLEGTNMHHCLYNCYWNLIKDKKYIAFHMSSPEDCTFSCTKRSNELVLDQIYLAYDKCVQSETKAIALDFISENKDEILSVLEDWSLLRF